MKKKIKNNIEGEDLFKNAMNDAKIISKKKIYKKNLDLESNSTQSFNNQNTSKNKFKTNSITLNENEEKKSIDGIKTLNYSNIDKSIEKKLKKGLLLIDSTLDLHGLNQNESYIELKKFVDSNYKSGNRYLLIITGKGNKVDRELNENKKNSKGILRSSLPIWLEESSFKLKIISHREAFARHGGGGARYIILRNFNKKKKSQNKF
ncbi:MAG: hypothetical protein CMM18_04005 [Rhodospirillaceae bacterium]|nr:hypothetical protein [Rhodospirillaceae bacterium]